MAIQSATNQLAHLITEYTHTVRDPLWRDIGLSAGFRELFMSEPMQKLNRIRQLGPAYLVYPGAVHTRLAHSLGVFHVTRLMLISLLTRAQRFSLSDEGLRAVLVAAMLHDMGHFPYAHALKDSVSATHEHLGAQLIASDDRLRYIIEHQIGTSTKTVCQIIDTSLPCDNAETAFLRTMLSGTLDPDKLDYLSRDALFCGIPYGMQDASYIIRHLMVTEDEQRIAIPAQAIGSVEHLLFAKYTMYRNVYWHHGTRSATAMIKKAVRLALADGLFSEHDLYDQDDESFVQLFSTHEHSVPERLMRSVRNNDLLVIRATLPCNDTQQLHQLYADADIRASYEQELHRILARHSTGLGEHDVIIDIPEDVSFESDIPVVGEDGTVRPFSQAGELFSKAVVNALTGSLRKIQLYTKVEVDPYTAQSALKGLLIDESPS